MNNITVIGNLTKDPELKKTSNDTSLCRCSVAVRRDRKEADGTYGTDFFEIVTWGAQAEFLAKNCKKGNRVCIAGSVHVRNWNDREGLLRTSVEIHVNNVESLTPKAPQEEPVVEKANTEELEAISDDDLPF